MALKTRDFEDEVLCDANRGVKTAPQIYFVVPTLGPLFIPSALTAVLLHNQSYTGQMWPYTVERYLRRHHTLHVPGI